MKESKRIGAKIIAAAARLYAEDGFEVPLSRIARAARVPEARLRRIGNLREQVLAQLIAGRWQRQWDAVLVDRRKDWVATGD